MRLLRKRGAWDKAGLRGRTIIALAVTAVAGLAACSSTPKAINPVELYRSAAGFSLNDDTSGERNAQNLAAGSNEPYPNLGTVPPPPDRAMSSIDRRKLQQGLSEDRTEAKRNEADLRGSGTAMAAPLPITRPSPAGGDAETAETKHNGAPSLPGARARANGAHRAPAGSEPAPQESALNSPDVHAIPEGDTPRPAPPPPYLPPPEETRKSSPGQASRPAPGATAEKRPASTPQTTATAPQLPAAPAIPPAAPVASAPPPPPPPSDLAMPPPNSVAAVTSMPPPALDPVPPLPPAAATAAPGTASPAAPVGTSDRQKLSAEQMAALDPARSPPPVVPVPAPVQTPKQEATLSPAPQALPRAPEADLAMVPAPQRTGRGTVSLQAAEINFADNGLTLTAEDDQRLAGVVKLYDKHGGIVRVVGYGRRGFGADAAQQELASFSKAIERANVVARALAQLGLASNRIVVQAAPIGDGLGEDRAEVLLEF
jgi:outer membrane protein OmpA-like peptidoglycan-associated protein